MGPEAQIRSLGSEIEILSGYAFPSSGFSDRDGIPLIRIRDLGKLETEVHYVGRYDSEFLITDGDILIGMDGDFVAVRWNAGPALLNQRVCRVSPRAGSNLDDGYLFYRLQPHLDIIHRRTPQTTVRHLSTRDLRRVITRLPALREQRRVAAILGTLDEVIRRTEQVIGMQQMKQDLAESMRKYDQSRAPC
jgi:type I restriction enzyme S subunit